MTRQTLVHVDRPWRLRHPLRPRIGHTRRVVMVVLMLLLWTMLGAYFYITNENRLRQIAADSLGSMVGGHVTIEHADLSIFEGLKLSKVRLFATGADGKDVQLLDAGSVSVECNLRDLLAGRLSATHIIVADPQVRLSEDVGTGKWNYQYLGQSQWSAPGGAASGFTGYPEVLLRDARVEYYEVRNGESNQVGWMAVDGRFGPLDVESNRPPKYEFTFQSRATHARGPTITGSFDGLSNHVSASLQNVVLGRDTQTMLPNPVSRWCSDHALAGAAAIRVDYDPKGYKVEADLEGVHMEISPRPLAPPIAFADARGTLIFNDQGIIAHDLRATCENNSFVVDGKLGGYSADSSMDFSLRSDGELNLSPNLPTVAAMPPAAQDIYNQFKPYGRASVAARLVRQTDGGALHCQATIEVLDGSFTFKDIPYPVHHVTGHVTVEHDDKLGFDVVRLTDVHGHGDKGSPNENAELAIDGWIGPFDDTTGGEVNVNGTGITYEPSLRGALPEPVRKTLDWLDVNHEGFGSAVSVSFTSQVLRLEAGKTRGLPWVANTDLKFANGVATCAAFPYRLERIEGEAQIRPGFVNVIGMQGRHGGSALLLGGKVAFNDAGTEFTPDLRVAAEDVLIDADLLAALPAEPRARLQALGVTGKLDANGTITSPLPGFNLDLTLSDGGFAPHGIIAATGVQGKANLTPGKLSDVNLIAKRGGAALTAVGSLDWTQSTPVALLTLDADNLTFEPELRDLLPARAKEIWSQIQPEGTADLRLNYDSRMANGPLALEIRPIKMRVAPRLSPEASPLRLDDLSGKINLVPDQLAEWDLTARDRDGQVAMSGSWKLDDPAAAWEMRLSGKNLAADEQLQRSLPKGLVQVLQGLSLTGAIGFDFTKLSYKPATTQPVIGKFSTTRPAGPDVDFEVRIDCENAAMNIGVPLDSVRGTANLTGSIRDGELRSLSGDVSAPSLKIALRPSADLSAKISKPENEPTLHISDLRAKVADGDLAGDLAVSLNDQGVDRYAMKMILNEADVSELSGIAEGLATTPDRNLTGRISASLELSGSVSDPTARRGTGDVRVVGDRMYQIPLVLGLLQVTNLALPTNSPFQKGTARYSVQGNRVTLEQIQLGGRDMSLQGSGHLDFATKKVDLTFTTDSDKWLNVPVVGPMWNKAENELMRIHVRGTLKALKVSASSLDTFTTTVDQVFKGEPQR